jgi:hypothetical protein
MCSALYSEIENPLGHWWDDTTYFLLYNLCYE